VGLADFIAKIGIQDLDRVHAETQAAWKDFECRREARSTPNEPLPAAVLLEECQALNPYLSQPGLGRTLHALERIADEMLPRLADAADSVFDKNALRMNLNEIAAALSGGRRLWLAQELLEASECLAEVGQAARHAVDLRHAAWAGADGLPAITHPLHALVHGLRETGAALATRSERRLVEELNGLAAALRKEGETRLERGPDLSDA
jgi:hypothetical protein